MQTTSEPTSNERAALWPAVSGFTGSDYWRGYQRGLHRHYHGDLFSTEVEHGLWLMLGLIDDPENAELGRGYRDGFAGLSPVPRS